MLITENIDQMQTASFDLEMLITENIDQMWTALFDLEMLITENIAQMCTASSTQIFECKIWTNLHFVRARLCTANSIARVEPIYQDTYTDHPVYNHWVYCTVIYTYCVHTCT
jgi:hypothetical protein